MEVVEMPIQGVKLIKPQIFGDARGWFYETYNEDRYQKAGIHVRFVQDNQSFSQKMLSEVFTSKNRRSVRPN